MQINLWPDRNRRGNAERNRQEKCDSERADNLGHYNLSGDAHGSCSMPEALLEHP